MTLTDETMIPLTAATDPTRSGAKASALARAIADGYPVPEGVVITVDAAADRTGDQPARLAGLVDRLGGAVAVRSSAIDEDTPEASFAGQYETVLDVRSDAALREAVDRCARSATTEAVESYRHHAHADRPGIAVLVQRMVQPSAAGVAFSTDPVSGDDHVVIEATTGVGEALLAGHITGERWTVDTEPVVEGGPPTVLDPSEAAEVAGLCRRLAARDGHPVDIEWAIEDGRLWLLQVRPITALPLEPTDRLPEHQTFVREPRVLTPIHPLSFSSWLPIHGDVFAQVFDEFGMPLAGIDHRYHRGRVYSRMTPLMDRGKDGTDPPLAVLKVLMRVVPAMRRRIRHALRWEGDEPIGALIDAWEREGRAWTAGRTRELRTRDLASMSDAELDDHVTEVHAHIRRVALDHFRLTIGAMAIPMGRLGLFVEEHLGWTTTNVFTLVQGYGHASVAHSRAIGALIEALGPVDVDEVIASPMLLLEHPAATDYLDRFGHTVHMDLAEPTEAEEPRLIAAHLRRHLEHDATAPDPTAAAHEAEQRALAELGSETARSEFTRLLALARRGRPLGDETEGTVLGALALMRHVGSEAARRFSTAGRLSRPDDVWFLELDELRAMLRSPGVAAPDVDRRRREFRWALAHPAPDHIGPPPPPMLPPSVVGRRFRSTLGAGFWALATLDGAPVAQPDEDHLLHGIPGSPGIATGTARIVGSPSEFARVEPGDIVVCGITTASWSPVFGVIGGIVTEQGGPLSHPGTLAREYGLAAVLSAPDATRRIPDGALVRVDGATGVVEILDDDR